MHGRSEAESLAAARVAFVEHAGLHEAPQHVIDLVLEALTWGWRQGTLDQRRRLHAEARRIIVQPSPHERSTRG